MTTSANKLSVNSPVYADSLSPFDGAEAVCDRVLKSPDSTDATVEPLLELKQVSYHYPQLHVLEAIDLAVYPGETVAILGGSGVGKTTLFHLIAGILPLQSGSLHLGDPDAQTRPVSYMLQKDLLLEHKTVLGNLALPLLIQGQSRVVAEQAAQSALAEFGLSEYASHYPFELSGGLRQRIALLRTYLFKQPLFLLDEAFSALDALTKIDLHRWYRTLSQKHHLTTLLITHDVDEAISLCDRVYLLAGRPGQIVAELDTTLPEDPVEADLKRGALKRDILERLGINRLETVS